MSKKFKFILYEPRSKDIGNITNLHNQLFKSNQYSSYYQNIFTKPFPFWMAVDKENYDLLGYIATKVKWDESTIYVASLGVIPKYKKVSLALIKRVQRDAIKMKAKYITTHARESSIGIRDSFKEMGFIETEAGTFKDGEPKFLLQYEFANVEVKDILKPKDYTNWRKYQRKNQMPKKPIVKNLYTLEKATSKDASSVLAIHNEYLAKKRELSYFSGKVNMKGGLFIVAKDSNGDVAGYLVCRPESRVKYPGPNMKWNLISMGVDEKYRGWGIAQAMIYQMFDEAKALPNIEYIYGHVRGTNKSAIGLYKKVGFKLRKQGIYKDDDSTKYLLFKRIRWPSLKPFWKKHKTEVKWIGMGVLAHEIIHLFRDYED